MLLFFYLQTHTHTHTHNNELSFVEREREREMGKKNEQKKDMLRLTITKIFFKKRGNK